MNRSLDWQILRYVGYALVFLCGAYLLYLVRGVLPLFLVAGLLAYAMEPVLQRLEQRGYSRQAAVFLVFLIFLLLFVCALALLASAWQQAQALGQNLPTYQRQVIQYTEGLQQRLDQSRLPPDIRNRLLKHFPMLNSGRRNTSLPGCKTCWPGYFLLSATSCSSSLCCRSSLCG
jgi:predicted PurR-regulated permease PerM